MKTMAGAELMAGGAEPIPMSWCPAEPLAWIGPLLVETNCPATK